MNRKVMFALMMLTVVACCFFVVANPVLSTHIYDFNYSEGECFTALDGHYDLRYFTLNNSNTDYFKVKYTESGHALLVDETGEKVINVIRFDNMIHFKKDSSRDFIDGELSKTAWMVEGVEVHEVEFRNGEKLYSACTKDISTGTTIYLATPNDTETASMINSLTFER